MVSGEKVRDPLMLLAITTCALTEPEGVAAEEVAVPLWAAVSPRRVEAAARREKRIFWS